MDSGDLSGQSFGNVHVQVGLVSYGTTLCGDQPGVYTRVDQFIPWIKDIIGFWSQRHECTTHLSGPGTN